MGTKRSGNAAVRTLNCNRILRSIWESGQISRARLSADLDLCAATVSSCVEALEKRHYVRMGETGASSGGRRPVMVEIDDSHLFCAGIEVKKTRVAGAVVSLRGHVACRAKARIAGGDFMAAVEGVMDDLRRRWDADGFPVIGIGVGVHGIVDYEEGLSIYAPAFGSRMVDVRGMLESRYGLPVVVDNDIRSMVLAEKWYGSHRDLDDIIFLGLDEGVGAGLMIGGKVYRGSGFAAGEIGHIRVSENGRRCVCGNIGCLDTVASIDGFLSDAAAAVGAEPGTLTLSRAMELADDGDPGALRAFDGLGLCVGIALASAVNMLDPDAVFIGGAVSEGWRHFGERVKATVRERTFHGSGHMVDIQRTEFGADDGVVGAASLMVDRILSDGYDLLC